MCFQQKHGLHVLEVIEVSKRLNCGYFRQIFWNRAELPTCTACVAEYTHQALPNETPLSLEYEMIPVWHILTSYLFWLKSPQ